MFANWISLFANRSSQSHYAMQRSARVITTPLIADVRRHDLSGEVGNETIAR